MRQTACIFILACAATAAPAPVITAVVTATNLRASPSLSPRALATIFGTNLSTTTATATTATATVLAGVEVHLSVATAATATCAATVTVLSAACEMRVRLIYVSPGQINFQIPDGYVKGTIHIALIRDVIRFASSVGFTEWAAPTTPGDTSKGASPFEFYDCQYGVSKCAVGSARTDSRQLTRPMLTDAKGNLITAANPVHPGQVLTLWITGLGTLPLNKTTALHSVATPIAVALEVYAEPVGDLDALVRMDWNAAESLYAGESSFPGLDQVNFQWPGCHGAPATTEQHSEALLLFAGWDAEVGMGNPYHFPEQVPLQVSPGEAACNAFAPVK